MFQANKKTPERRQVLTGIPAGFASVLKNTKLLKKNVNTNAFYGVANKQPQ